MTKIAAALGELRKDMFHVGEVSHANVAFGEVLGHRLDLCRIVVDKQHPAPLGFTFRAHLRACRLGGFFGVLLRSSLRGFLRNLSLQLPLQFPVQLALAFLLLALFLLGPLARFLGAATPLFDALGSAFPAARLGLPFPDDDEPDIKCEQGQGRCEHQAKILRRPVEIPHIVIADVGRLAIVTLGI